MSFAASRAAPSSPLGNAVTLAATLIAAIAFGRVHQLFGPTRTLPVGKILLPLMVVLILLCPDLRDRISRLIRAPQAWFFIALIGAMIVSVPSSLLATSSLNALIQFLQTSAVLVLAIGLAVRHERDLFTLVTGVVVSIALLGAATAKSGLAAGGVGRFGASDTYDPNDVAFACVVALPLALWLLTSGRRWFHRLAGLAGMGGALLGVVYSGSRGGFLGLAAVLLALVATGGRRALPLKWRLGLLVIVSSGLALAPGGFWTRLNSLTDLSEDYNLRSETGRKQIWKRGIRYTLQRPLWGVGFEQFEIAEGKLAGVDTGGRGWKWSTAHNSPLQVAAELGILGLLAWLGLYIPTWRITRRAERYSRGARAPPLESWGKALRVALIGFFVSGFFLSQAYGGVAMTLAGLGIATTVLIRRSGAAVAHGGLVSSPAGQRGRLSRRQGRQGGRRGNARRIPSPAAGRLDGHLSRHRDPT